MPAKTPENKEATLTTAGLRLDKLEPAPESLELVFGLVAPIGVDLNLVEELLDEALREVSFDVERIKITELMAAVKIVPPAKNGPSHIDSMDYRINYANRVRERLADNALALLAIREIRSIRARSPYRDAAKLNSPDILASNVPSERPLQNTAYIIRQLKRPEEVETLRRVYGKRFVLISVYAPINARKRQIADAERRTGGGLIDELEIESRVNLLIARDSKESSDDHGQALRDAFPLGDVFVDTTSRKSCEEMLGRFVRLLFGANQITPTRDEYAMYAAKAAALRSSDLSRQIGAAIFSQSGEVVTLGCNEVPKAGGGTYWEGGEPDDRDFALGYDPNERLRREVLTDLIDRLKKLGDLSESFSSRDSVEIVEQLLADDAPGSVADSRLMDIIEFGRIIHAEMSALSDAARNGLPVASGTLYCTTFPCHLCAKHIVAAGIKRVVFLEPYPKSYAWKLHSDSIELDDRNHPTKVSFEAFIGVSPLRYRDLFEKKGRKNRDGIARKWVENNPLPVIDIHYPNYFELERDWVARLEARLAALETEAEKPGSAQTRHLDR